MLQIKGKRLSQAKAGRNYKACEQVTGNYVPQKWKTSLKLKKGCLNRKPNGLEDEKQEFSKHQEGNRNQNHLIEWSFEQNYQNR